MYNGPGGVSTTTYIDLDSRAAITYEVDPAINSVCLMVNDGRDVHLRVTRTVLDTCIDALTCARTELMRS